jgi:TruB family pseudouridylate synthase (N terminal domain)
MKAIKMLGVLLSLFSVQAFPPSCRKKLSLPPFVVSMADTSTAASGATGAVPQQQPQQIVVPLLLTEGIMAVHKPSDWTSSDVVSYIRGVLERDARSRGSRSAQFAGTGARGLNNRKQVIKVGHGGTLDPLATGVLVIGVGDGTKQLETYVFFNNKSIARRE